MFFKDQVGSMYNSERISSIQPIELAEGSKSTVPIFEVWLDRGDYPVIVELDWVNALIADSMNTEHVVSENLNRSIATLSKDSDGEEVVHIDPIVAWKIIGSTSIPVVLSGKPVGDKFSIVALDDEGQPVISDNDGYNNMSLDDWVEKQKEQIEQKSKLASVMDDVKLN